MQLVASVFVAMPGGISGAEPAERRLLQKPDLKVIFTSGHAANEISAEVPAKTRACFLQKPYSQVDPARTVRDCPDKNKIADGETVLC